MVISRRRQYFINPKFQIKFTCLFTLALIVFSLALPIFVIAMFDFVTEHEMVVNQPELLELLNASKGDFFTLLIIMEVFLVFAAVILSIFHSHKIAGPLYKLQSAMSSVKQGVLDRHIMFRKHDNFMELAQSFNEMSSAIFERHKQELESVNMMLKKMETLHSGLDGEKKKQAMEVLQTLQNMSQGHPEVKS